MCIWTGSQVTSEPMIAAELHFHPLLSVPPSQMSPPLRTSEKALGELTPPPALTFTTQMPRLGDGSFGVPLTKSIETSSAAVRGAHTLLLKPAALSSGIKWPPRPSSLLFGSFSTCSPSTLCLRCPLRTSFPTLVPAGGWRAVPPRKVAFRALYLLSPWHVHFQNALIV